MSNYPSEQKIVLFGGGSLTISVAIKVNDGLVLAADSATTMSSVDGPQNVYNNANKVFNLRKGLPIGVITWGCGSIDGASIATLVKDFRELITDDVDFKVIPNSYSIHEVADQFFNFIYNENYLPYFESTEEKPGLGFIIGGYSHGSKFPEEYLIQIEDKTGNCNGPTLIRGNSQCGASWFGVPEPLTRIINGFSLQLPNVLIQEGVNPNLVYSKIMPAIQMQLQAPLLFPAMPIQDTIDLARFMVNLTATYIKYSPMHNVVGGPIEIAAITKHEGFKWIQRKLYFDRTNNPYYELKEGSH